MLIVGMFFFWIAVTSGLCGFADIFSEHLYAVHAVFYSSLLLATLTFSVCLFRPSRQDPSFDEAAAWPAAADVPAPSGDPDAVSLTAGHGGANPQRGELVIAGPLVAGVR